MPLHRRTDSYLLLELSHLRSLLTVAREKLAVEKERADSLAGEHFKLSQELRRALEALWLIRSFVGLGIPGVPGAGFFVLVLYRVYFGHSFFARAFRGLNVSASSSTSLSFSTP
jgi:hypothetical protein